MALLLGANVWFFRASSGPFVAPALSPLQGFHRGWAKPETHGFQTQEPSLKPETQHETHSC